MRSFIKDYDNDLIPLEKLSSFLNKDPLPFHEELLSNNFYNQIEIDIAKNWQSTMMNFTDARLLYIACRILQPHIIIETGVNTGLSSAMILLALKKNNKGHLYSIDLPIEETKKFLLNKAVGWLVPDSLKERWTLELGDSKKILPKILNNLKRCDIFLHDSDHSYAHMIWEYETVWPFLKKALLSDDINQHTAFDDFVEKYHCRSLKFSERMGLVVPDS